MAIWITVGTADNLMRYCYWCTGETRRQYDADLTNGMPFTVRDFAFADPYDIFDDFQSFKGCLFDLRR